MASVSGGFAKANEVASPVITDWSGDINGTTASAAWSRTADRLVVTTFGSGSCPRAIQRVELTGPQEIYLTVVDTGVEPLTPATSGAAANSVTYPRACTRDLRPYTMVVIPPASASADKTLTVRGLGRPIELAPIN
ncbi:hypothetical protein ABLG96_08155 [Nakamurella sp. A5-74]|uniref:Uncharacterized protein n=1 Tax=Nakamurella sp. A5-74 TaxID=3158264 RepID=A0AAU8DSW9_9ACTN